MNLLNNHIEIIYIYMKININNKKMHCIKIIEDMIKIYILLMIL